MLFFTQIAFYLAPLFTYLFKWQVILKQKKTYTDRKYKPFFQTANRIFFYNENGKICGFYPIFISKIEHLDVIFRVQNWTSE